MNNMNIDDIVNKWFDMKYHTYDKLEHDGSIYLYYNGEKYADIRINKKDKLINYQVNVWNEFSQMISLEFFKFEEFMVKWVEDTFGLKEFNIYWIDWTQEDWMILPK